MPYTIPYYNNLTESFSGTSLSPSSPDFELLKFEEISSLENRNNKPFRLNAFVIGMITSGDCNGVNKREDLSTIGRQYLRYQSMARSQIRPGE